MSKPRFPGRDGPGCSMGIADTDTTSGRAATARALLLSALALAACLCLWRGSQIFTVDSSSLASGSPEETRLAGLLEPVAGTGKVRVSLRNGADGTAHYLVMLDRVPEEGAELPARIEAVVAAVTGYDLAAGDTLSVQQFPFAAGTSARPEPAALIEMGALAILCALLAGALMTRQESPVSQPVEAPRADPSPVRLSPVRAMDADMIDDEAGPALRQAGQAASADPTGAAQVIRRWMNTSGGAA